MTAYARRLRREATIPERKLWQRLKDMKKLGYHFRRQVPFRAYILDFAEHTNRVVIELDGGQHTSSQHAARDAERDQMLESEGYLVLRWGNNEITNNLDQTMEYLVAVLKERPPTRTAARFDLPTGGR